MARGKGKNWPKSKILAVLKSAHQKFSENALSKLKNSFCEIYLIKKVKMASNTNFTQYEGNFELIDAKEKLKKNSKIFSVLKSAHQKFLDNALSIFKQATLLH